MKSENSQHIIRLEPFIYSEFDTLFIFIYNTINGSRLLIKKTFFLSVELKNNILIVCSRGTMYERDILYTIIKDGFGLEISSKFVYSKNVFESAKRDIIELKSNSPIVSSDKIRSKLIKLTLCMSDIRSSNISNPVAISKQIDYLGFIQGIDDKEVNDELLINLIDAKKYPRLQRINIYVSDIRQKTFLISSLSERFRLVIFTPYNIDNESFSTKYKDNVSINFIANINQITDLKTIPKAPIHIFIADEWEYKKYVKLKLKHNNLIPHVYYNNNLSFIKKMVSYNIDEIFTETRSMKALLRNSHINELLYGELIIHSNGNVLPAAHSNPISNIINGDTLDYAIEKAISDNNSWLFTRSTFNPCKGCIYRYFCPPLSETEIMSKSNYCINGHWSI